MRSGRSGSVLKMKLMGFVGGSVHIQGEVMSVQGLSGIVLEVSASAQKQLDQVHSTGERSRLQMSHGGYCSGPGWELEVTETGVRMGPGTDPGALRCLEVREMRRRLQRRWRAKALCP